MQNPKEATVVRFTNIFDFDYTHAYGGVPYQLRAGATYLFPWAIGDHLATHLARQALIRKAPFRDDNAEDGRGGESKRSDRPLWDDKAIEELKARIIKEAYTEEQPTVMSEAERFRVKVEELNKEFPGQATAAMTAPVAQPPADNDHVAKGAEQFPAADGKTYQDKAEVIAALTAKGIAHNPRASKANLEKLL